MNLDAARRKVRPAKLATADEPEHVGVDPRAQRFDAIPNERIPPMFVAVKKPDLQRHSLSRERPRQTPRLDDDAIVEHRVDRVARVFVAEKFSALVAIGEARP